MTFVDELKLERDIEDTLGVSLKIVVEHMERQSLHWATKAKELLSPDEEQRFLIMKSPKRRLEWLLGRLALRRLQVLVGKKSRCSLAHSGPVAMAAGTYGNKLRGIGIDLEIGRTIDPGVARFFLSVKEKEQLKLHSFGSDFFLRLWTAKEALFKATPLELQAPLSRYTIENLQAENGNAVLATHPDLRLYYASFKLEKGFFSAAYSV